MFLCMNTRPKLLYQCLPARLDMPLIIIIIAVGI